MSYIWSTHYYFYITKGPPFYYIFDSCVENLEFSIIEILYSIKTLL